MFQDFLSLFLNKEFLFPEVVCRREEVPNFIPAVAFESLKKKSVNMASLLLLIESVTICILKEI